MPPLTSKSMALGSIAPDFELPEPLTGKVWKLADFEGHPALLVTFICNHCPFVVHLKKDIVKLANDYMPRGLAIAAISSNSAVTYPQDGPDFMAEDARTLEYPFPYLYDEEKPFRIPLFPGIFRWRVAPPPTTTTASFGDFTQEVARAYGAVCTPEFYLFKKNENQPFELAYRGQFDDSRPNNNKPITGSDIRQALDSVLSGQPLSSAQKPSVGCSIKWHPSEN